MFLFIHFSLTPPPVKSATRRTSRDTFTPFTALRMYNRQPHKTLHKTGENRKFFFILRVFT